MFKRIKITSLLIIIIITSLFIPVYAIETNESQQNQNIDSVDYEIAKILFKAWFEDEFNEDSISEAKYNSEGKEFSCEYIIKNYDEEYKKDSMTISTKDFLDYRFVKVEYRYDEEQGEDIPHSTNSNYNELTNEEKNKVINLASSKGYYTSKNLSDEDFLKILKIIFLNDTKNLKNILNENQYVLKNYYISEDRIHFMYTKGENEEYYIQIKSRIENVDAWNVFGTSDKKINEDFTEIWDSEYAVDYDIIISQNKTEINTIYDKLKRK